MIKFLFGNFNNVNAFIKICYIIRILCLALPCVYVLYTLYMSVFHHSGGMFDFGVFGSFIILMIFAWKLILIDAVVFVASNICIKTGKLWPYYILIAFMIGTCLFYGLPSVLRRHIPGFYQNAMTKKLESDISKDVSKPESRYYKRKFDYNGDTVYAFYIEHSVLNVPDNWLDDIDEILTMAVLDGSDIEFVQDSYEYILSYIQKKNLYYYEDEKDEQPQTITGWEINIYDENVVLHFSDGSTVNHHFDGFLPVLLRNGEIDKDALREKRIDQIRSKIENIFLQTSI